MNTPIMNALKLHAEKKPTSFHVPGHKSGLINPFSSLGIDSKFLNIDLTEISGLDDLHAPEEVILDGEKLLSDTYGSKKSFFLVNGTTVGNLAMILACVKENERIVVQRNCHKSIVNAIKLAKGIPVFLPEKMNRDLGVAAGAEIADVEEIISSNMSIAAIVLTYPNYYGCTYDIKPIIDLAHHHNIPVLVDEAHGAHFIADEPFPKSAVALGADVVVHSAHKTLPAMTMGSYLHFNSEFVNLKKITELLAMLQTSSPSYVIMASLDFAREYIQNFSSEDIRWTCSGIDEFCFKLTGVEGIKVVRTSDPLKVVIQSSTNESGYSLQKRFESVGIYTELADSKNVLFVMPLLKAGMEMDLDGIVSAIKFALASDHQVQEYNQIEPSTLDKITSLELTFGEMEQFEEVVIDFSKAAGQISAETIIPYPPGIPLVIRGERITQEQIDKLSTITNFKGKIQGNENIRNGQLAVFL